MVFHLPKLRDWQTAGECRLCCGGVGVLLGEASAEELDEGRDAFGFPRNALRKHLHAGEAKMRERFITPEEIDHFYRVRSARINRFQRGDELIHGQVDRDHIDFTARWRREADLVRNPRACDKNIATTDVVRKPGAANVSFLELR